jgi:hypothetical protein
MNLHAFCSQRSRYWLLKQRLFVVAYVSLSGAYIAKP